MKKTKLTKLLCIALSWMMLLSAVPLSVSAEATTPDYFYIRNLGSTECTIQWTKVKSPDDVRWYSFDKEATSAWEDALDIPITLGAYGTTNDTVYFKGNCGAAANSAFEYTKLTVPTSAEALEAGGDITTLLNCLSADSSVCGNLPDMSETKYTAAFNSLFRENKYIKRIDDLKLPSTTLAESCYAYMFLGCEALEAVPENLLPAKTLASRCYQNMFCNCYALTNVPKLPATTIAEFCYMNMFMNCKSLETVPKNLLPAATLVESCYSHMFQYCNALTNAPDLPAKMLASHCYENMFQGCAALTSLRVNFEKWDTAGPIMSFLPTNLKTPGQLKFGCTENLKKSIDTVYDSQLESIKNNITYPVYQALISEGTAETDRFLYFQGETATVTVTPPEGKQVSDVSVNSGAVEVKKTAENVYTFTMPAANADIRITFEHAHSFSTEWTKNAKAHWHICTTADCPITSYEACGIAGAAYSAHTMTDGVCSVCGEVFTFTANDSVLTATAEDETAYTLTLTENGTLSAEEAAAWLAAGLTLPKIAFDTQANTASITVREATASVTLADEALKAHTVKVICGADDDGNSYLTDVMPGTDVTVTAGSYEGKAFERWNAKLNINGSPENQVTFTMPNEDVTIEAEFVDCYPLSIFDGTTLTSTPQKVNTEQTVTAPTMEGMRFTGWTAEGITLTDPTAATLKFTMPANAVMLTLNYATLYTVTVEDGTITGADTSGTAIAGETVSVTADTVSGHNFTGWTGEGIEFANAASTTTTFTMPEGNVTVKANFEQIKVTAPTAGTNTYTYNGNAQTYQFTNEGDVSYYKLIGDSTTQTNAGTYTVKAQLTVDGTAWTDGTTADKEYTFVIARQTVEKPVAYDIEYNYDGNPKSFILCKQENGKAYYYQSCIPAGSVTIENDTRTDAGTQTVTATPTANYCWADGTDDTLSFTFTVKRYAIPVLFDDPRDFTYDATEQTYTPFIYMDGTVYDFDGLFYDLSNRKQTAAGIYTVTATLKDNFCWQDGSTAPRNMKFEIKKKEINSYIYHIKDLTTGELTTSVDIAYTIYDNIGQLKGFEGHKKPQTEMLKDRYKPYLVNAPEGSEVTFFITENRDPETMQIGAKDWNYVKMSELKPDTVYYAFALVSHPDYEYAQLTEITDCCRFHTPSTLYTLVTKEEVTYDVINETQAFDVISAFMEGGYNGIIGSFASGSSEESKIVKVKVQRFSDIDAAVLQGIKDIEEEELDYAAISFELLPGHTYFYDMTSYNVNNYKAALGIVSAVRPAADKVFASFGAQPDETAQIEITDVSDEPAEFTAKLMEAMFPSEASPKALDSIKFKIAMDPELALSQLNAKNEELIKKLNDAGLGTNGTPENYFSTVRVSSVLYDPNADDVKVTDNEYEFSAGEMLPENTVKEIEGYTLDGLYYNDICDFELNAMGEDAAGDHGRILTQGLVKWDPEENYITRDMDLWAIYIKNGTKEPVSYKASGKLLRDAGSEVTITLPAIFNSMSYGDVINDNADITVSAVTDGKVTVTAKNDLTGSDPLTFKVNVNANAQGVKDPFYYILVTVNVVDTAAVKAEATAALTAIAENNADNEEVLLIIEEAITQIAAADSAAAVEEIKVQAEAAIEKILAPKKSLTLWEQFILFIKGIINALAIIFLPIFTITK